MAEQSMTERYILVTVTTPDGSDGTPDPEKVIDRLIEQVWDALTNDEMGNLRDLEDLSISVRVRQAYPGEEVGEAV